MDNVNIILINMCIMVLLAQQVIGSNTREHMHTVTLLPTGMCFG